MNNNGNGVSPSILEEIINLISNKEYGSVEIYIESGQVVQITERTIRKTNGFNKPNGINKPVQAYNSTINNQAKR